MEPEMIWLEAAISIKEEPLEIKQEHQDYQLKHDDDTATSEEDSLQNSSSAMIKEHYNAVEIEDFILKCEEGPVKSTKYKTEPHSDIQKELDSGFKHEDNAAVSGDDNPIMVGKFGALSSSVNNDTSLTVSVLPDVSETDEDISEHTNLELYSYVCDFCDKKFNELSQLLKHTVNHKEKQSSEFSSECDRLNVQIKKNNSDRHMCNVCNKSFTRRRHLNIHIKAHTGQGLFPCEICNKSYTTRGNLNTHMRTHTGQRQFSCDICNKSFTERGSLNTHIRTHTGERPYSCEICNKSFKESGPLSFHMKIHTGERPFSCNICNKSFRDRGHLYVHMKTHTGERPFSCSVCNKTFRNHRDCKIHTRGHTDEYTFSCELCRRSFKKSGHLNRHKRTHLGQK